MKKILYIIAWFLSSFVLMVYISFIEDSRSNNFLEDFLYKAIVEPDNVYAIYIAVAIPFIAIYMYKPHWFSTPKNQRKDLFKFIEDKLFLRVRVVDEETLKFEADYNKDEEFDRKWKDGKIHDIIKEFKKELKDKKFEKVHGFKIEFLNEHDFVRKENVDIRIKIIEKEENQNVISNNFEKFVKRIEQETYLVLDDVNEDLYSFKGDLEDEDDDFYKKYASDIFTFEDKIPKILKEIGKKTDIKTNIVDVEVILDNYFVVKVELIERGIVKGANKMLMNLTNTLEITDRKGDNPELIKVEKDKNKQTILFFEDDVTLEEKDWLSKMPQLKKITKKSPEVTFLEDEVKIGLYDEMKIVFDYNMRDFMKYLKRGKYFVGINNKQEPVYIDIKSMIHFLYSAITGGGKGILMRMFLQSAVYNVGTDSLSTILILDPKMTDFKNYKDLNDPNIRVYTGEKETVSYMIDLWVEFEARRIYIDRNGLTEINKYKCLAVHDEYDTINDLESREEQEFCDSAGNDVLRRARYTNTSYNVTTQDVRAETIKSTFRNLFGDTACGMMQNAYDSSLLISDSSVQKYGFENAKSLNGSKGLTFKKDDGTDGYAPNSGRFIMNGTKGFSGDEFIQTMFTDDKDEPIVFKEVYEKGKRELEQDDGTFVKEIKEIRKEVLENFIDTNKWGDKVTNKAKELYESFYNISYGNDVIEDEDYDDVVYKGSNDNQRELIKDNEEEDDDLKDYQSARKKRLTSFITLDEEKEEEVKEVEIAEKDDKDIDKMFELLEKKRKGA